MKMEVLMGVTGKKGWAPRIERLNKKEQSKQNNWNIKMQTTTSSKGHKQRATDERMKENWVYDLNMP